MYRPAQLMGTPVDALSTGQKVIGFGGAAVATAALVVSFLHKSGATKAVAGISGLLGAATLTMAGVQMTKTHSLMPAPGGDADRSNSAAFGALAFGGGALLTSALALLIGAGSCKAPKALGRARGKRR